MRRLHRWLGISAAAFLLLLCATGLALNHSSSLGLDSTFVGSGWLLDRYGFPTPAVGAAYRVGDRWVAAAEGRLFVDDAAVAGADVAGIVGAIEAAMEVIVAAANELLFLDRNGALVERLPVDLPGPAGITGIAESGGDVWLRSDEAVFRFDLIAAATMPESAPVPTGAWSLPDKLPVATRSSIEESLRGRGISIERVLVDLHSGRLLGVSGVVVMDLAALALAVLAVSGLLLWIRR